MPGHKRRRVSRPKPPGVKGAGKAKRARKMRLFRAPTPGGASLVIPLKCAYREQLAGVGTAALNIDKMIGLDNMLNPDWYNRHHPMWSWIRINKVRIDITCPYNIGQAGVGGDSLFKVWSKKAFSEAEVHPNNEIEWMNMQSAKKRVFRGKENTVSFYYTPAFEAPQGATTAKRLMYKQWFEMPSGPTAAVKHLGIIASIFKMDGSNITPTDKFGYNVTLYCQVKGLKQL